MMMQKIYGPRVAAVFTVLVLWTALGSVFALLLGYSRIPFAAAREGYFFKVFARLHPKKHFPHVSLVVMGVIAIVCSFLPLMQVIDALLATRILVQFVGQVVALILLRKNAPNLKRPYRMWLYPIPALLALVGWFFVFGTTDLRTLLYSGAALLLGVAGFLCWARFTVKWPFQQS